MDNNAFVKSLVDDIHKSNSEWLAALGKWASIPVDQVADVITSATHAEFCGLFGLALVARLSDVTRAKVTSVGDVFAPVADVDSLGMCATVNYPLPFLAARAAEYLLLSGNHPAQSVRDLAVLIFDTLYDDRMPLTRELGRKLTVATLL